MTQEMSADQRHRPAGTEDLIGSPYPDEHRDPDQARLDDERPDEQRTIVDEDRDRDAIDGLDDDRIVSDRLAEYRAASTGLAEDLTGRETDRAWTDDDRVDGEPQDGVRMHDEGRFDGPDGPEVAGSADDQRISPQSMVPHHEGEQDTGILRDGRDGTPRDVVPQSDTLFGRDDVDGLRARWIELQASFVDEPRSAVQQADQLVAEVMQTMASMLSTSKHELEGQWQREGTADTEDLRQAMRQYRSFFDKLLHV